MSLIKVKDREFRCSVCDKVIECFDSEDIDDTVYRHYYTTHNVDGCEWCKEALDRATEEIITAVIEEIEELYGKEENDRYPGRGEIYDKALSDLKNRLEGK